jgi:uncharacterized Zn finger protein (UPF0148 family)
MEHYEKYGMKIYEELKRGKENEADEVDIADWVNKILIKKGIINKHQLTKQKCQECFNIKVKHNNRLVCPDCGLVDDEEMMMVFDVYSEKAQYKAMTHFKDWIIKSQAKHSPTINPNVYKLIQFKHPDPSTINYKGIKLLLKKNKLFNYYEDIWFILKYLKPNETIFTLSNDEENILYKYFSKISLLWVSIKPTSRKSIISYPFIIIKLLEMIGRSDLIKFFIIPAYEKFIQYEKIWSKIYPFL